MVSAFWSVYQYLILIWMLSVFTGNCLIGFSLVITNIVKAVI
jgi:hypothetical protein